MDQQRWLQFEDYMTRRDSEKIEGVRRLFQQDNACTKEEDEESETPHAFPRKRDWSQLTRDVCRLIAEKAAFNPHIDKFASACKEWCNISKEIPPPLMLFLPFNERNNTCRFIAPMDDVAVYDLKLPEMKGYWICGCTNGWLGLINDKSDMVLFNPMTHARVPLPRFSNDRVEEYLEAMGLTDPCMPRVLSVSGSLVSKLVISGNPDPGSSESTSSCLVAVIFRPYSRLAVCRLGDESWTVIRTAKKFPRGDHGFGDIVFHKETLYANNKQSYSLYEIDNHASCAVSIKQIPIPFDRNCITVDHTYLVMSSENILHVEKHKDLDRVGTARRPTLVERFTVLELDDKRRNWKSMKDLGGRSLFLGLSSSMSVLSSKESSFGWCRPDCIYFLDDSKSSFVAERRGFQCDNGIFSVVENRVITRFDVQHSLTFWPAPALWYQLRNAPLDRIL